jgi:hypothetical protein
MKIKRWSPLTGTLFLALTMSGGVWAQDRHIVNGSAEFGWRVEDNKKATTSAGTAVLKDDQLKNIVPGNAVNVDARSFDVSQPIAGRLGSSSIGTNLVGTPGIGIANTIGVRNMNVAPPINIPVIPSLPVR